MMNDHEWLNLIDISGPFLAGPVLSEHFPMGLETVPTKVRQRLRSTFEEWQLATDGDDPDAELVHEAWIENVLTDVLEFEDRVLKAGDDLPKDLIVALHEHGTSIRPDMALVDTTGDGDGLFLIHILEPLADLEGSILVDGWVTTPVERMTTLLRGTGCPVGMLTNGDQWMLIHAPVGEVVSKATWHARIWLQETDTLRAFVSLLRVSRFFGPPQEKLPALFEKSKGHQDEVTEALGDQVARAIEVLVQSLDHADEERNRELLKDVKPADLYEAGLTVMMRLVFLLAAEERNLILLGDPKYDAYYAVSNLRGQLRLKTDELLERDHSAWSQLLAVFRMVYGGVEHPALRLPALGGSLFDPDRFPFLEGRAKGTNWQQEPAVPLPIDDRTVLLLLEAIQIFKGRTLSYKGLDVEQIGHVYEGLLEKTVRRVEKTTLELKASNSAKNPFVTLDEIDGALGLGGSALRDLLVERSGRGASAIQNDIDREKDEALIGKLLTTCRGDSELSELIEPLVALLNEDAWGYPLVHPKGAFVIGLGQDRRESGSHYTPKSLTEKIVEETLTPAAFVGPAEGKPREEWKLRSSEELLDLKVCDPAMGSGAFLVQACRWLSDRLVEAWSRGEASGQKYDVEGHLVCIEVGEAAEPLPRSPVDRAIIAKRVIAEKCLYGVDLNPLAVELAKLSLWLTTLSKGHPFGFLDHNLKCGNSLLGIDVVAQVVDLSMTPSKKKQERLFGRTINNAVEASTEKRLSLREIPLRDIQDVEAMTNMDRESRDFVQLPILLADALVGIELSETTAKGRNERIKVLAGLADDAARGNETIITTIRNQALKDLATDSPSMTPRKPFHWPLEFPEVFDRENSGFDAFVGNPPFMGGQLISGTFGEAFQTYLKERISYDVRSAVDIVVFFFLHTFRLLRNDGCMGLLARRSISEGKNREAGLAQLLKYRANIISAGTNIKWPGQASVIVHRIHILKGDWVGGYSLNDAAVETISSDLSSIEYKVPSKLAENRGRSFQGSILLGEGFKVTEQMAGEMINSNSRNADVLFPFIGGNEVNKSHDYAPPCWVINFWDWPGDKAATYRLPYEHILKRVKSERSEKKKNGEYKQGSDARENWWIHLRPRPALYHAIGRGALFTKHPDSWNSETTPNKRVMVISTGVTKFPVFTFLPPSYIYSNKLCVIADDRFETLALLSSDVHGSWAWHHKTSLGGDLHSLVYAHGNIFETFPFPDKFFREVSLKLRALGEQFFKSRQSAMKIEQKGLTKLYNIFHNPKIFDDHIVQLRELQTQMNKEACKLYGWDDFLIDCDFHQVAYLPENDNVRFSISEEARIKILRRLTDLNKRRSVEEVAQDLHENKVTKKKLSSHKSKTSFNQNEMDI